MAQYRVTETAYLDGRVVMDGETVTLPDDTVPGPHMVPLDATAHRAAKGIVPGKVNPIEDLARSDRKI